MAVARALVVVLCAMLLQVVPAAAAPVTGNATHFAGLGSPYGGCGMPPVAGCR